MSGTVSNTAVKRARVTRVVDLSVTTARAGEVLLPAPTREGMSLSA